MGRMAQGRQLAGGLRAMKAAAERERWPAERMAAHQREAFDALVRHAVARSPLHRERLGHLVGDGPVDPASVPPGDKATLMDRLDDAVCDERLRGVDLRAATGRVLPGGHHVLASSGSTGAPSVYVYSPEDWTSVLAMFLRANEMAGVRPRIPRLRVAPVGTPSQAAMSTQVTASIAVGVHRVMPLHVTAPVADLVDALNAFQPGYLHTYPSVGVLLADEQLAGRLSIRPSIVSTGSELRTPEMTERMAAAWGVAPFDLYATSEGVWGMECEHHDGIHLFEDYAMVENVDASNRPVPDGEPGERLLVTNLFNRALPLIRFVVSDSAVIDRSPCPCGRTLARLRQVRGRSEDVLRFAGADGAGVPVHPAQFSVVSGDPGVREFQVVQRGERVLLRLVLRDGADPATPDRAVRAVCDRLAAAGVRDPAVGAEVVDALQRNAAGKLRLVVREEPAGAVVVG